MDGVRSPDHRAVNAAEPNDLLMVSAEIEFWSASSLGRRVGESACVRALLRFLAETPDDTIKARRASRGGRAGCVSSDGDSRNQAT
jgi:hypothetical protein